MKRYAAPIQSNLNPATHQPTNRPYDRLRAIIKAAEHGEKFTEPRPPRRPPVQIGKIEKLTPVPRAGDGQQMAMALNASEDPFGMQIPVADATTQELRTAQQAGTRQLAREGDGDTRLSYRRTRDGAVFFLSIKTTPPSKGKK
jgi:hypothetical protein